MDIERALLTKVLFTGQVEQALARSISEEHFADDECRDMWHYIVSHTRKYKLAPSVEAAKHDKPDFEFLQVQDALDWLIDRFTVLVKRRMADDLLIEIAKAADDPERRENIDLEFLEASQRLISAVPSNKVERLSTIDKRHRLYEERKKAGFIPGIPYGYPTLDRATGGIRSHELVSVLGFVNSGKSTCLRSFAHNFWLKGFTPLYFSLEMEADAILEHFDAMTASLDIAKLKQLNLPPEQMDRWRDAATRIKASQADIPIIDSIYRMTPEQVYAEMLRHKPDVAIVDYVGLMRSSYVQRGVKKYQQITDITQDLKICARMLKTPIIMAAQTNRSGAKDGAELDNVADAISIVQDSDTVIGLFQDEDMEKRNEMEIRINKSRSGPRPRFIAVWDHAKQEYRERVIKDMFQRNGGSPDPEPERTGTPLDKWMNNEIVPFGRKTHA